MYFMYPLGLQIATLHFYSLILILVMELPLNPIFSYFIYLESYTLNESAPDAHKPRTCVFFTTST